MSDIRVNKILDTMTIEGRRITTFEVVCPSWAWVHLLTHRSLSRNASSNRALPNQVVLNNANYVPEEWGVNNRYMHPNKHLTGMRKRLSRAVWVATMKVNKLASTFLYGIGVHKELANRLVMPFQMVHGLVTGTADAWQHFIALRATPEAQKEIREVALQIAEQMVSSAPAIRRVHVPFVSEEKLRELSQVDLRERVDDLFISAGRCARVSYLNHNGELDPERDLALAKRLWKNQHLSPFEHVAVAHVGKHANYVGWISLRRMLETGIINEQNFEGGKDGSNLQKMWMPVRN